MLIFQPSRLWRRGLLRATLALILFALIYAYNFAPWILTGERPYDVWPSPGRRILGAQERHHRPEHNPNRLHGETNGTAIGYCADLAAELLANKIQPILKTGAKEHSNKLLNHLDTVSSCIEPHDLLIFSDLQSRIGAHTIHDALDRLPTSTTRQNPDFDVYYQQQALQHTGESFEELHGGWMLDKYKFLPMVQKAWQLKPGRDWYVFFETDTYVFWRNMVEFLSHFDPTKAWYFGSPVWPTDGSVIFAHGGSGFILSGAAMEKLNSGTPTELIGGHEYGEEVKQWCCGDQVLASVLRRKDIGLRGYWPMFNGEKPSTLSFDDESWCQPILTLHHLSANELAELWVEERNWRSQQGQNAEVAEKPLTFEKLFQNYIFPSLPQTEEGVHWDYRAGLEGDPLEVKVLNTSIQKCRSMCENRKDCLQYRYHSAEGTCGLSKKFRLGEKLEGDVTESTVSSGWIVERISRRTNERKCKVTKWVRANP